MPVHNIRWARIIGGALVLLMGLLWALQGAGVVGGSAMTRQSQWLIVGAVLMAAGLWLAVTGLRGGTPR